MVSAFLRMWIKLPLRYPRTVLLVCLVLTLLSFVFIPRLHVSTDRNLLAGKKSEVFKQREKVSELFGTSLVSLVIIEHEDRDTVKAAADALSKALLYDNQHVKEVFHKVDVGFFEKHALMFAPEQTVGKLAQFLSSATIDADQLAQINNMASAVSAMDNYLMTASGTDTVSIQATKAAFAQLELATADVREWLADESLKQPGFVSRMWEQAGAMQGGGIQADGYLMNTDGKPPYLAVMFIQPANDSQEMDVVEPLTDFIKSRCSTIEKQFVGSKTYLTGMPSLQTEELRLVTRDCIVAGIAAGLGVILVFVIAFRSFRVSLFLVLPLGVGLVWSAGFTGLVYGHLTMITSYFAAVLFGLGVAFTIHIVARFHEALLDGESKHEAVGTAIVKAGPGVLVGGITTAFAFLAIVFSEFNGFAEMGVISGMGVMLILLANISLLPAALLLWHPGKSKVVKARARRFLLPARSMRLVVIAVSLLLFVVGIAAVLGVQFNYAVESMLPQKLDAVRAIELLSQRTDFSSMYSIAVADSQQEAAEKAARFEKLATVARAEHVGLFMPLHQDKKVAALSAITASKVDAIGKLKAQFASLPSEDAGSAKIALAAALKELSYSLSDLAYDAKRSSRPVHFELDRAARFIERTSVAVSQASDERVSELDTLLRTLAVRGLGVLYDSMNSGAFSLAEVPPAITNRFVSKDKKKFAVIIYPNGDIGDRDFLYSHVDQLLSVDSQTTGHPVTHRSFTQMIHRGFYQAVALAFIAVFVLLIMDLRTVRGMFMGLGPVLVSAGWTALTMYLFDLKLNYANIMALPILIGTGVDYGVHIAHRMHQCHSMVKTLETTGRAVVLSGVTTLIGFGSLLLGNHWGVQSLGLLLVIGIFFSLIVALFVLPLLFQYSPGETAHD